MGCYYYALKLHQTWLDAECVKLLKEAG
jgi:hypothetical protein